ncbi:MAG: hypothetical protein LC117_02595 [Bacteroidia bacterium]|nr:hypothetical protein [Bacteroidia bacterium]MCZ2276803.1 hypothetical protein [Bacteroidia bacterium]
MKGVNQLAEAGNVAITVNSDNEKSKSIDGSKGVIRLMVKVCHANSF